MLRSHSQPDFSFFKPNENKIKKKMEVKSDSPKWVVYVSEYSLFA